MARIGDAPFDPRAVGTDLLPKLDNEYTLGNADYRWKSIHIGEGTIYINDAVTNDVMALTISNGVFFIDGLAQAQLPHVAVEDITFLDGSVQSTAAYMRYGSFYDTTTQTGTANSIQAMKLNTTDFVKDVSIVANTKITMAVAGKYNIAFSAQVHNQTSSAEIQIWLNKNGTPMANTNTKIHIEPTAPYNVAAWNLFVDAAAGDYYELMWSSNDATTQLQYAAATGSGATLKPAIPSVILTVNQVG